MKSCVRETQFNYRLEKELGSNRSRERSYYYRSWKDPYLQEQEVGSY
jgi:hypothetical protein